MTDYCIKAIRIWRYSTNQPFDCKIELDSGENALVVKLPPERVAEIINLIADVLVDTTRDVATELTHAALQHTAIEHQPEAQDD